MSGDTEARQFPARVIAKVEHPMPPEDPHRKRRRTAPVVYVLLATPWGMRIGFEHRMEEATTEDIRRRWTRTATLHDFVESTCSGNGSRVTILASSDPNAQNPVLDRCFQTFGDFAAAGFNLASSGGITVNVVQ